MVRGAEPAEASPTKSTQVIKRSLIWLVMARNEEKSLGGNNGRSMLIHVMEEGTKVESFPSAPGHGGEICWRDSGGGQ